MKDFLPPLKCVCVCVFAKLGFLLQELSKGLHSGIEEKTTICGDGLQYSNILESIKLYLSFPSPLNTLPFPQKNHPLKLSIPGKCQGLECNNASSASDISGCCVVPNTMKKAGKEGDFRRPSSGISGHLWTCLSAYDLCTKKKNNNFLE